MERVRKWALLGRLAAIARGKKPDGSALLFEKQLAASLGLTRTSLRTYADAVRSVRAVPDPHVRGILFRSSAVAAAVAARWFHRDPDGLRDFIRHAAGSMPLRIVNDRALLAAERSARSVGSRKERRAVEDVGPLLRSILDADWTWRAEIAKYLPSLSGEAAGGRRTLLVPVDPVSRFLTLTYILTLHDPWAQGNGGEWRLSPGDRSAAVGFIEIPPRVVLERYRAEARNFWARCLAASLYVELVVLVLPSSAARRQLLSQLPLEGAVWVNHPSQILRPSDDTPRGRSRPILARVQPSCTVLLATRRSLRSDLFQLSPQAARS